MARLIGEAYIVIYPNADGFGPKAEGLVKKGLAAVKGDVPVSPKLDDAAVAKIESELKTMGADVPISPQLNPAAVARIREILSTLGEQVAMGLHLDQAALAAVQAELNQLHDTVKIGADLDPGALGKIAAELTTVLRGAAMQLHLPVTAYMPPDTAAKLQAELWSFKEQLPLGISPEEMAKLRASIDSLLQGNTVTVPVRPDLTTLVALKKTVDAYIGQEALIRPGVSPADLGQLHATIQANLLRPFQIDPLPSIAALTAMRSQIAATIGRMPPVPFQLDTGPAIAKVTALAAYAKTAMNFTGTVGLNFGMAALQALALSTAVASLKKTIADLNAVGLASGATAAALVPIWGKFFQGATTGWGILNSRISLFAGAFDRILPEIFSSITVWHAASDYIIEFAAVLVPATLGITAFGLAIAPVAKDAAMRLQAMQQAASALGVQIGQINYQTTGAIGPMQKLQNLLQPTVWQLTGDAINVMNAKAGMFTKVVMQVNTVVQDLAVRMEQAFTSKSAGSFMNNAALDFQRFGTIIGNFGGAFGNILKDMPGYAEIIQQVWVKISAGVETFTAVAGAVIKAGLAFHGFLVYVGLAFTAGVALLGTIGNLTTKFFTLAAKATDVAGSMAAIKLAFMNAGTAFADFVKNFQILLASNYVIALAAIGLAAYAIVNDFNSASTSVTDFIRNITTGINSLQGGTALQEIPQALNQINQQMKAAASPAAYQQLSANWANLSNTGNAFAKDTEAVASDIGNAFKKLVTGGTASQMNGFLDNMGKALKDIFVPGGGIGIQVSDNVKALQNAFNGLSTEEQNLLKVTASLMEGHIQGQTAAVGYADALGIINAAGVQANDSITTMTVKVSGLLTGWQQFGLNASQIGQAVNALALQAEVSQSSITKLTGAYSAFIGIVTSGESTFSSFGTGLGTLSQALSSAGASGVKFTDSLGKFSVSGTAAGATMNGISQASLNVRNAFASEITNATGLFNALTTMSGVSASGAKGQNLLAQAGKDMVAVLLPLAKGSQGAMAELSALAQLAGGPATTSFTALSNWVGKTANPMADLNKIEQQLTVSSSNLLQDTQNLAGAMGETLTSAISGAIFAAEKGPQVIAGLANAMNSLANGKGSVPQVEQALKAAMPALVQMSGSTALAKDQFLAMAAALHINTTTAGQWWDAMVKGLPITEQNVQAVKNFTAATQQNMTALSNLYGSLGGSTKAYDQLFSMLTKTDTGLVNNTSQANLSKQAFINFAEQGLNKTASEAAALWKQQAAQNLTMLAGKASTTESSFVSLAKNGLNLTTTQAEQLWTTLRLQYLDTLVAKGDTAKNSFIQLAEQGLNLDSSAATELWNTLKQQYLDTLASKAGETQKAFEQAAGQFGLTKGAADKLWASLHQIAADSPYTAKVNADTSAAVTALNNFNSLVHSIGSTTVTIPVGVAAPPKAASGMFVTGGTPGKDSVPIMAMPGEVVVPTHMVQAGAVNHLKGSIPGFAGGGVVGMPYSYASQAPGSVVMSTSATAAGMPGMTLYQADTLIGLIEQQNKLLAQMPYTQAQAINQANSAGVRRGWFATGG